MGGKGGGGKKGQELIHTAVRVGQQTERQSLPSRALGFQQASELLSTGGIGARLPMIAKALEAVRSANATSRTNLESGLAANGLEGTPFGLAALAQQDISAGMAESQAQQQASANAISQIAQILNLGPVVAAPFAGGTSAAIAAGNAPGADYSGLYAGLGSVLGAVASNYGGGGGGGGGGGTPPATGGYSGQASPY